MHCLLLNLIKNISLSFYALFSFLNRKYYAVSGKALVGNWVINAVEYHSVVFAQHWNIQYVCVRVPIGVMKTE